MTGFLTGITEVALHVVGWGIMLYVVYIAFTWLNRQLDKIGSYNYNSYNERQARRAYEAHKAAASAASNSSNSKETGE